MQSPAKTVPMRRRLLAGGNRSFDISKEMFVFVFIYLYKFEFTMKFWHFQAKELRAPLQVNPFPLKKSLKSFVTKIIWFCSVYGKCCSYFNSKRHLWIDKIVLCGEILTVWSLKQAWPPPPEAGLTTPGCGGALQVRSTPGKIKRIKFCLFRTTTDISIF